MSADEVRQFYSYIRWLVSGMAAGGVIVLSWLRVLDRRSGRVLSMFSSHEKDCLEYRKLMRNDMREIKAHLTRQDERAQAHRENVAAALGSIGSDVAALKSRDIAARGGRR